MPSSEINCQPIEEASLKIPSSCSDEIQDESPNAENFEIKGLVIGKIVGYQDGSPKVMFGVCENICIQIAKAVVGDTSDLEIGSQVCLAFEQQRSDRPIVLGRLNMESHGLVHTSPNATVISDNQQITICCGKASIRLTADGTVAIRGTNVASRASHTNRIRGGNVQIN